MYKTDGNKAVWANYARDLLPSFFALLTNTLLFVSIVVPTIPINTKNFSSLFWYYCLVTGDFTVYKYSDHMSHLML